MVHVSSLKLRSTFDGTILQLGAAVGRSRLDERTRAGIYRGEVLCWLGEGLLAGDPHGVAAVDEFIDRCAEVIVFFGGTLVV